MAVVTAAPARYQPSRLAARLLLALLAVIASAGLPGCGVTAHAPADPHIAHGLRLPATFLGDLPCADCEGIRHHLDLWPDQVFHLRREWLGRDLVRADVGRWRVDPERQALVLQGGAEMPLQFGILGADRLRQLNLSGSPITSELPYELRSGAGFEPTDVSLLLGGEMSYQADSPRFTECLTGRSYPILPGSQALLLQRAYLAAITRPGEALYASFEGTITRRPAMDDGERLEPVVVVDRFVGTWPGQTCSRGRADASLLNTYWRIVRLQDEALGTMPGRREPHLVLRASADAGRYSATVGCNQLNGRFGTAGDRLSFAHAASTRMACPPPLADLERRLGEVLAAVRQWRILGNTLSLQNGQGDDLALLEAVYF
jgi:heat shock protein HslJ/uncharacterized lipoprotein NlpE involved in copper resistance